MKVEKITATIRYSQDTGKGAWKVIELGAEATISDREFWQHCQQELYHQLSGQLKTLWGSKDGTTAALNSHNGAESHIEPPTASEPTPTPRPHWCDEHQAEFKRRQKAGVVWYSHRQGKGWCNEPEPAERR